TLDFMCHASNSCRYRSTSVTALHTAHPIYRCLGGPSPHQPAISPQAHPSATAETVFQLPTPRWRGSSGISHGFPRLSRTDGQVAYVLVTRPPLDQREQAPSSRVRLACIRHAASVHPEPGSNSP